MEAEDLRSFEDGDAKSELDPAGSPEVQDEKVRNAIKMFQAKEPTAMESGGFFFLGDF